MVKSGEEKNIDLRSYVTTVFDFPVKGVIFRDVTPILRSAEATNYVIRMFLRFLHEKGLSPTVIIAPEARGFILGGALAYALGIGFMPARKNRKLPGDVFFSTYSLEYEEKEELSIKKGDLSEKDRVIIVDDLVATGGTVNVCKKMIREAGAHLEAVLTIVNLTSLNDNLPKVPFFFLIEY